jgi:uncharacterized membrane protein YdfJ with MMPL/SSD domain
MMTRLAGVSSRRPWWVVAITAVFFAVALTVAGGLTASLSPGGFEDPDAEFVAARDQLQQAGGESPAPGLIVLVEPGGPVVAPEGRATIERIAGIVGADPQVSRVLTAFNGGGEGLVSTDGSATYMAAYFTPIGEDEVAGVAERVTAALDGEAGVQLGGTSAVAYQINDIIKADLLRAELIAFPIIFLLSLWVFRGVVAALLPSMMGALVIFGGFLGLGALNTMTSISVYALNLVIGLGLGLAIDYSLLVVSRYREEIAALGPGFPALIRTLKTAGRSVVFSAITVAAALAGLMIFPQPFLFSMGLGGITVALAAAVAAVVVLPAVLALLGSRVNALAPRRWRAQTEVANLRQERGFWVVLSRAVMRRPGMVAALTTVGLLIVALPALGINFTTVDAKSLPASVDARVVSDRLATDFNSDLSDPIFVALDGPTGPEAAARVQEYADRLAALPGVQAVPPPTPVGDGAWRVDLYTAADPLSDEAQALVERVRAVPAPFPALTSGLTASFVDQKASIAAHLPWAVLIIALATIIALFIMTGSVILPLKAVVMNLLTLAATLGLLVWIFQDGRFEGLLGYQSVGALDLTSPILLGAMAFGLATDYTVFLLARIKEAHDAGEPTPEAVAHGLQRTGRIVTAAALLFAVAIGAFVSSDILLIKQLGFGTAAAVLIDATIIRALLVPSLMALFGRWNWWAPGPLRRLHRRIGLSEEVAAAPG